MKRYLLIGTGIALLAGGGVALAQMSPGGMDRMERGGYDGSEMRGPGMHGPGMMPPHDYDMMRRHHGEGEGPGSAAAFRFKRGDMEIGIRCSEREPVQACVNAASALFDKINGASSAPKTP